MNKEHIAKYGLLLGRRKTDSEKELFLSEVSKEFNEYGYNVEIMKRKFKKSVGVNAYIGDVINSKNIIIAGYDTPHNSYSKKMKYYPHNPKKTERGLFFHTRLIALAAVFLTIIMLYIVLNILNLNENQVNIFWLVMTFIMVTIGYFFMQGSANKHNVNLTTSNVLGALEIAKDRPKNTAFILVDNSLTNNLGDRMVDEVLKKNINKKTFIILNAIGGDGEVVITHKQHNSKLAKKIHGDNAQIKVVSLENKDLARHSLNFYSKAVNFSVLEKDKDEFFIRNVMSKYDTKLNEDNFNQVVDAVKKAIV